MMRVGMTMHTAMTAASLSPLNTGPVSDSCAGDVNDSCAGDVDDSCAGDIDDAVGGRYDVGQSSFEESGCRVDSVLRLDKVLVSL